MKPLKQKKAMSKMKRGRLQVGHTYLLRGIPDDLWRSAKAYAGQNGTTVREMLLNALREVTK